MLTEGSISCIFYFGETESFVPQDDREYVVIIIIDNLMLLRLKVSTMGKHSLWALSGWGLGS
jgi:hypothetical protein